MSWAYAGSYSIKTADDVQLVLYIPGCMIVSFDDSQTHTTEVKLVRVQQEVDLGRLRDTHDIYKEVIHDRVGVHEATERLEEVRID